MRVRFALTTALLAVLAATFTASGADAAKRYVHPKYKSMKIQNIGMLQWMERKQDVDAERIMRLELAKAVASTEYTFTNPSAFRTLARSVGAESLLVDCMDQYRANGEIRAETVKALGSRVSVDAILAPFLDRWEKEVIPVNVRGNSRTEIGARLALYSTSTGELLWTEYIEEMGEGPYNDPSTQAIGTNPLSGRAGAATGLEPPSYEEIADKWSRKCAKQFPPRPKPAKDAKNKAPGEASNEKNSDS